MPLFVFPPLALYSGPEDMSKGRLVAAHHAKATHAKAVPHKLRRQNSTGKPQKPVPNTDARTLLPMNGGTPGVTAMPSNVVVQNPTAGQGQGQAGPPITLIPDDSPTSPGRTTGYHPSGATKKKKWSTVAQLYFDAGAEDLVGTFTTLVLRAGIRYYDDELDVYFRNETLDTEGTGLAFQQVINGASFGADWRHWFLKDHVFITVSDGYYVSGPYKDHYDFRAGAVASFGWQSQQWFTDIYSDLFYVDLLSDTIFTERLRSGPILFKNRTGQVIAYGVEQLIADTLGTTGSEDRVEAGFGVGYIFEGHIALNIDLRAGYAFRGAIENRTYLNPMIVLSGSF